MSSYTKGKSGYGGQQNHHRGLYPLDPTRGTSLDPAKGLQLLGTLHPGAMPPDPVFPSLYLSLRVCILHLLARLVNRVQSISLLIIIIIPKYVDKHQNNLSLFCRFYQ